MFNHSKEIYVVVTFITLLSIVLVLFLLELIKLIFKKNKLNLYSSITLILGFLGIVCILYGYFIEPYRLNINYVKLSSDKLKSEIKIVQMSDIHSDGEPRLEKKIPKIIQKIAPDIIVLTGDYANSRKGYNVFSKLITELSSIAPIYAVRGNWDISTRRIPDRFKGLPIIDLDNKVQMIKINDNLVYLCGQPVNRKNKSNFLTDNLDSRFYSIFLFHYPYLIQELAKAGIDLCLCGHTHAGQVALPFYGALITSSKFGKKYEHGLYNFGQTKMYVNGGIGMEGGMSPRVRFCAIPEITVFEIRGTKN